MKVIECWNYIEDNDMNTFRSDCSLWSMGYTENRLILEYNQARAAHPEQSELMFFNAHFGDDYNPNEVRIIRSNIYVFDSIKALIVGMHIAEGLTRNDK